MYCLRVCARVCMCVCVCVYVTRSGHSLTSADVFHQVTGSPAITVGCLVLCRFPLGTHGLIHSKEDIIEKRIFCDNVHKICYF